MKGEEKVNRVENEDVTALLCHLADNAGEIPLMSRVMMAHTVGDLIDLNLEMMISYHCFYMLIKWDSEMNLVGCSRIR